MTFIPGSSELFNLRLSRESFHKIPNLRKKNPGLKIVCSFVYLFLNKQLNLS